MINPSESSPAPSRRPSPVWSRTNNQFGVDESGNHGYCDFDADGVIDTFFATGATWWYSSGGTAAWRYLNTSTRRLSQLTLGDADGDGRCDVRAGGMISSGGTGPWRPRAGGIVWRHTDGRFALWSLNGGTIAGEVYRADVDNSWQVRGTGDFNGDRSDDILWQNTSEFRADMAIWHMSRLTHVSTAYPGTPSSCRRADSGSRRLRWRRPSRTSCGVTPQARWRSGSKAILTMRCHPAAHPGYSNSSIVNLSGWSGRSRVSATSTATGDPTSCGATQRAGGHLAHGWRRPRQRHLPRDRGSDAPLDDRRRG